MNRNDSKIKFVGLHAHSVAGSIWILLMKMDVMHWL